MTRVQILLREDQDRRLEALARRLQTSKASLVRRGVDSVLAGINDDASDPLVDLIGQAGRAGRRDISRRHDEYLSGLRPRRRQ